MIRELATISAVGPALPENPDVEIALQPLVRALALCADWIEHRTITITASYTLQDETFVRANAATGNITVTLPPAASSINREVTVKKLDSSANSVIVDGNASETIDGATTFSWAVQYQSHTFVCNGTSWDVI